MTFSKYFTFGQAPDNKGACFEKRNLYYMEQPKPLDDLYVHKTTILSWIRSCKKAEQIPVCEEAVKKLVTDRFILFVAVRQLNILDLNIAEAELFDAIDQKRLLLTKA